MTDRSNDPAALARQDNRPVAGRSDEGFPVGIDDGVIVPVVAVAFAVWRVLRGTFFILIDIVDFLFPILLQVMRFPLFTLRILGDALAALLKGIVRFLPVGGERRAAWREVVSEYWKWLRQKFSYKAFEEWLHHAFEVGMAWVFRACRTLTPRAALLVLIGAVLWLPISFTVATLIHAVLIAKALSLPAWMQLLHPVATVIAKSKLLVLPVYPAAWPQAKRHPAMQALIRSWNYFVAHDFARKTLYRYRQTQTVAAHASEVWHHTAAFTGLTRFAQAALAGINATAAAIGNAMRSAMMWLAEFAVRTPLLGAVIRRYDIHYDEANRVPAGKFSERVRGFYQRWSVKFTAEYYEAKERQQAAKGMGL
jgi:hypothetical protein